jgi:DNA-binding response OmpR family regulator
MLTAVESEAAREKASSLYNEDYITKPAEVNELRQRIVKILERNT